MARVTVEDCAQVIPSRFELVALAAQRARIISAGGELTVERDNDKDAVVALREIADRTIDANRLRENLIESCQERVNVDAYGVENEVAEGDEVSSEAAAEMSELQNSSAAADEVNSLYGGDDVSMED